MGNVARRMDTNFFKKGATVFKEGDIGNEMFIIKSGSVEVVKNIKGEEVVLATLEHPSFFGEMALFGDNHRSATIRAAKDTELIPLNKANLEVQLRKAPDWFVAIMRTLIVRLKDTNRRLKSRYSISLEYSILKLLYMIVKTRGTKEEEVYKVELSIVTKELENILSVSRDELAEKLKDLSFVQMIKYSEAKNEILMRDEDKVKAFLLFLQGKKDKKTRLTHAFEELLEDNVKMQYFEKVYRLISRKKGEDDG